MGITHVLGRLQADFVSLGAALALGGSNHKVDPIAARCGQQLNITALNIFPRPGERGVRYQHYSKPQSDKECLLTFRERLATSREAATQNQTLKLRFSLGEKVASKTLPITYAKFLQAKA